MGADAGLYYRLVDRELLVRTEYLAAENRIFRAQLKGRLRLSDAERATLGEIGHRLGRQALAVELSLWPSRSMKRLVERVVTEAPAPAKTSGRCR